MAAPTAVILHGTGDDATFGDCDCGGGPAKTLPSNQECPALLRLHPALLWLTLDDEHVVACVPSLSRVAVLNRVARALLGTFAGPRHWRSLAHEEAAVVEQAYHLGLLTAGDGTLPPPSPSDELVAWLHVTNACNLRCTYCYIHKTTATMSATTARAAVDAVIRSAKAYGYGRVLIKYAGGEASLALALVEEAHAYAQEQCRAANIELSAVLLSNGTALSKQRLALIRRLGLRLTVSLDGLDADNDQQRPTPNGSGSAQAACAGIERALALGIVPGVSVTVTGDSVGGLPQLLRWLLARELPFTLSFARPIGPETSLDALRGDERRLIAGMRAAYAVIGERPPAHSLLGSLLDRAHLGHSHGRPCAVGENYLVIDHNGRVAKCQMEIARPVTTVDAAIPLALVRADQAGVQNLPVEQKAGCAACPWRHWCAGGCPVATFRATGRYDLKSPNCAIYQALFPDVVRLEGQRLLARIATPA